MKQIKTDILIIGAGIIGVTLAIELKKKFPDQKILVIEKESAAGFHASGRNSGVLHAGFYYTEDSLKAKFCREGNIAMREYCLNNNLKLNQCGKLVIAKNKAELAGLKILYDRGIKNNVRLEMISEREAREIEPHVTTYQQAIFSPDTASVDPVEVINLLVKQAESLEIQFLYSEKYISFHFKNKIIITNKNKICTGLLINCAGLHADKIAKQFGFGLDYHIVPFKGLYLYADKNAGGLKTHIYPVPDLNYPFLGVHFTVTVNHQVKIGPTAIPAFWREQYDGLSRFSVFELFKILTLESRLFLKDQFHFRAIAMHELKKYNKKFLCNQAKYMLHNMDDYHFKTWGKPGIRAQLVNQKQGTLVNDFCFEGDKHSFHVLNAVSPAFTCSFPFAKYLVSRLIQA